MQQGLPNVIIMITDNRSGVFQGKISLSNDEEKQEFEYEFTPSSANEMAFTIKKSGASEPLLTVVKEDSADNAAEKFDEFVGFTGGLVVSMLNNNTDMYQYDEVEHAII